MGTTLCCDNGLYESVAKESENNKLVDKRKIHRWFSIVLVWTIILSALVQFSMFSSILAPFLSMLDPSVDAFFGTLAVVAYSLGQMITPPLFGLWGNKTKNCRRPISCGLLTIATANMVYCYLEYFPLSSRKWIMLAARFVVGLGAGIVSVGRTYCATASTFDEQQKAIAGSTAALGFSVIVGPGAQGLFALIGYPGFYVHGFHIHAYNAPAVASVLLTIVLLFLNSMFLLEEYPGITDAKDHSLSPNYKPLPKYDKVGAWLLVWLWFCTWCALTNFVILGVPFTQAQFDWSLKTAIAYNGAMFGLFALASLLVYTSAAFLSHKCQDKHAVLFGMIFIALFYLLTFPWPFYHRPSDVSASYIRSANASLGPDAPCAHTGTKWCPTTPRIPMILYLISFIFMAIGFPVANASLSTLLSKLIGPRKQGIMQGIYVTTGGFARLLGPLVTSLIFIRYGPQHAWLLTMVLMLCGTCMAVVFQNRLVGLETNPVLNPGQHYPYKSGILYRF